MRHMIQRQSLKCAEGLWKANQGHLNVYAKGKKSLQREMKRVKVLNYS